METHIKAIKEARFAFIDNWDDTMTTTPIPNYKKRSLYHLLNTAQQHGERIFQAWNQSQLKSIATSVNPNHTIRAASLLEDLVHNVQVEMKHNSRLRLRNLHLPPAGHSTCLASRWQPPSAPKTGPKKTWEKVASKSNQVSRPPARTITVIPESSDTTTTTTMTQVTADMKEMMSEQMSNMLAQLLPGMTTLQTSIQKVSACVTGLLTHVSNLGAEVQQQKEATSQVREQVNTLETDLIALSQRVQDLEKRSNSPTPSSDLVPFLKQQETRQVAALKESFRSVFQEFHTPKQVAKRDRASSTESRSTSDIQKRRTQPDNVKPPVAVRDQHVDLTRGEVSAPP